MQKRQSAAATETAPIETHDDRRPEDSVDWAEAFLRHYEATIGNIAEAARRTGISRRKVYSRKERDPDFAQAFREAQQMLLDSVECAVLSRARDGYEEPIFHRGEEIGSRRRFSDTLAQFILKARRPEVYARGSLADRACDILLLGQTLTTDVGDSGSRALGDVHRSIEIERLEAYAASVAEVINRQLIPSIIRLNFGEESELPWVTAPSLQPIDEVQRAERDRLLFQELGLPVAKQWLYERHRVPTPGADDELFQPEPRSNTERSQDAPEGAHSKMAMGENKAGAPVPLTEGGLS